MWRVLQWPFGFLRMLGNVYPGASASRAYVLRREENTVYRLMEKMMIDPKMGDL